MKTTAFIDPFGIKTNSICTDCSSHTTLERYLISSINIGKTHAQRGTSKAGYSRLLDLLSLTT